MIRGLKQVAEMNNVAPQGDCLNKAAFHKCIRIHSFSWILTTKSAEDSVLKSNRSVSFHHCMHLA